MNSLIPPQNIGMILLDYLRNHYNDETIDYEAVPEQIQDGFESTVYKFKLNSIDSIHSEWLILRVNHHTYPHIQFLYDTAVQNALSLTSLPIAKIHIACDDPSILGGTFTIMDCLSGDIMWNMPDDQIPAMLANTHVAIHSCNIDTIMHGIERMGYTEKCIFRPVHAALDNLYQAGLSVEPIKKWLHDHQTDEPTLAICHGDFHPSNILVRDGQVSGILDWHFYLGEPESDVALTHNILTINSKLHVPETKWQHLDDFTQKYLYAYQEGKHLDPTKLRYYRAVHCLRDLGEGVRRGGKYRTHPYRVNTQRTIVENITGLKIPIWN